MPPSIAVLISGTGRSLKNLLDLQGANKLPVRVELVISSRGDAGGLEFARQFAIRSEVIRREDAQSTAEFSARIFDVCRRARIDLVVLAGFLKQLLIPADFQHRVLNIHPSLIPAFCGKGFYGLRVHQAVLEAGARLSGCTVHYVDDEYDHGPVILQKTVPVLDDDTPESLAARVFAAECQALPEALRIVVAQSTRGGP
jgi:phosphoribosylglycinamide formyltransferase-1